MEYYDPNMFICSPENPNTMGFTATLYEPIDGDLLREAVESLRERFPYFYVRAKAEGNDLIPVPNPLPITVRNTWDPIDLCSREANYHLAAVKYEGNRLALEMCHSISDGPGFLPFFKSILFCYLSRKTGQAFDPAGFRLPGDIIPERETGDPFADLDIDSADAPLIQKEPAADFYRLEQGRRDDWQVFYLKLPEDQVMCYCRDNDGSPNVVISVLLAKAIRRNDPDSEKTIIADIAIDHKALLGNFENYRMFANTAEISFPKKREDDDIMKSCTIARGQLMLQAQPENSLYFMKMRKTGHERMKQIPSLQMKADLIKQAVGKSRGTVSVSYINSRTFGPLDPFIREVFAVAEPRVIDVLCEVFCINHSFFVSFNQKFSSDNLFKAFMKELEKAGINGEIIRSGPLRLCGVRYDDLEGVTI